jgi:hypothetical protein
MAQALYNKLPEDGIKQFGQLKTDAERFAYVWKMSDTHEVVQLEPEYEKKSAEKAKTHREKVRSYSNGYALESFLPFCWMFFFFFEVWS